MAMLRAQEGSGLRRVLHSHVEDCRLTLAANVSNVQAKARLTDRTLFKVRPSHTCLDRRCIAQRGYSLHSASKTTYVPLSI